MHTCTKKADNKQPHQYDLTQQDIRTHKSRDCTQLRSYPAQLFSVRATLWTLPILLKLSHCSILSRIYQWVCIPTVKLTGDSCIATVPGRGRGRRENQSGSRDGPVWASVRDLEWLGNCSAASEKGRNQENKSVQQVEFEDLSRFRRWVRKECWLHCIGSHDGCVYLLHNSLLNLIDWLENNNYILQYNDKYLLH